MTHFTENLKILSDMLWGGAMAGIVFLFAVWATLYFHFPQKKLLYALRESIRPKNGGNGLGTLACLTMHLAATLGVGNIVGVAIAIELGGPGAVFWCCFVGFFAMAINYGECLLSIRCRKRFDNGIYSGGPMYVLREKLGKKKAAFFYAISAALTGLGMGAMVSSNAVSSSIAPVGMNTLLMGFILTVLTAAVLIGGVESIADLCMKTVPVMVIIFLGGCCAVLYITRDFIGEAVGIILKDALNLKAILGAAAGGGVTKAIRYGVSRGIFSNEAGMGSSAITASSLQDGDPVTQALVCSTGTFWDTCVLCALTGLSFVCAMQANPALFTDTHGFDIALRTFSMIPFVGTTALISILLLLGFSSIIGWSYVGSQAFSYLTCGKMCGLYRILWIICVLVGSIAPIDAVWYFSDLCTAAMIIPNLWSIFKLRKECRTEMEIFCYKNEPKFNVHRIFTHKY